MKVADIMTRRVVTAHPDTDVSAVARLMLDNRVGAIPVVDDRVRVGQRQGIDPGTRLSAPRKISANLGFPLMSASGGRADRPNSKPDAIAKTFAQVEQRRLVEWQLYTIERSVARGGFEPPTFGL
jgi:CBS domain-containing protein